MDYKKRYFMEEVVASDYDYFVMGADVGGTNTNMSIAGIKDLKPHILFSFHFQTNQLTTLTSAVNEIVSFAKNEYEIDVRVSCIAAAGIISEDKKSVSLTNASWDIDIDELKKDTTLDTIFLINDFQAIGYGINMLDPRNSEDLIVLKSDCIGSIHATKVIIGAGTGLGKSILVYNEQFDAYIPIPSEGGHTDFPFQSKQESELVEFVRTLRNITQPLPYEELLSGRGLEAIYLFLRHSEALDETEYTKEIDGADEKAELISKYRSIDETCKQTFSLFTTFYGRCAKNFVLDTLSEGGLYIAGGIASKNKDIFSTDIFKEEFYNGYRRTDFLRKVPISIVLNYDISLYGTCFAAVYFQKIGKK